MIHLRDAARARVRRIRSGRDGDDGFALVYVLLVSTVIMIAVASMMVVTASNIIPARTSQNTQAALAAANGGIQDAVAYLNRTCKRTGTRCDAALGKEIAAPVDLSNGESYTWQIDDHYVTTPSGDRYLRVSATGEAGDSSKTLVADIAGINGVLDYEYYSTYETVGSQELDDYYTPRNIAINCDAVSGAKSLKFGCPAGSTATAAWDGAEQSSPSDAVCDKLWYDSATLNGAEAAGRYATELGLGLPPGADWTETGAVGNQPVSRDAPCQVAFATGMEFDGPVYTVDAPLISNTTIDGSGPTFDTTFNTAWGASSYPRPPAQPFRSDPYVGGTPSGHAPSTRSNPQTFSMGFNPDVPPQSCVYLGPTRVYINGDGTATITSPQTTSPVSGADPACYPSAAQMTNGIVQFTVNYIEHGNGIIYVKNNSKPTGGFGTTGQRIGDTASRDNTVFYIPNSAGGGSLDTGGALAPSTCDAKHTYSGDTTSTSCAWSNVSDGTAGSGWAPDGPGWTKYSAGTTCYDKNHGNGDSSDQLTFACDFNGGSYGPNIYQIFRHDRIQVPLTRNSLSCGGQSFAPASATAQQMICYFESALGPADSYGSVTSAPTSQYAHQYVASLTDSTSTTSTQPAKGATVPAALMGSDPLFQTRSGSSKQETVTTTTRTYTVGREVADCSGIVLLGACVANLAGGKVLGFNWSDAVPQFQVRISQTNYSNLSSGPPTVSYFPNMNDVTQYTTGTDGANDSNGLGDVYIQSAVGSNGSAIPFTGKLAVLADNDAIVTGAIKRATTSDAMLIDALGNVRVYHPVKCAHENPTLIAETSPGFCPNDLTGLYKGGLDSGGTLSAAHPAMQYVNMAGTDGNADGIGEIDAAVVAQGGSLLAENADRGTGLGDLTVNGGIYQLHRGALGTQWELKSSDDKRASSGYRLQMTYANLQDALPYVPTFQGGHVGRYWNVVSVSSATGPGAAE